MNSQIFEEASEWVVRHRCEELGAGARREFDAWLRASPAHVRAYLEMSAIWENLPAVESELNPDAAELIARAREESNVQPLLRTVGVRTAPPAQALPSYGSISKSAAMHSGRSRRYLRYVSAAAAALLVAVGVLSWTYFQRDVYATGIGEQRSLLLADGSRVDLDAHSRIRVRFSERERHIELLSGQALFKVTKDPARPFIVTNNETRVRAVGTQFDVYDKPTGTVVSVVEGRVAVRTAVPLRVLSNEISAQSKSDAPSSKAKESAGSRATIPGHDHVGAQARPDRELAPHHHPLQAEMDEVLLEAGEQLFVAQISDAKSESVATGRESKKAVGVDVVEAATAWTQQRLVFNASRLVEVAEEFNRYNRRGLIIDDKTLNDFHISGNFSSTDLTLLIRFLRNQPEIVVNETADAIHITRRPMSI